MKTYYFRVEAQRFIKNVCVNNAHSIEEAYGTIYSLYGKGARGQSIMLRIELLKEE